MKSNAQAGTSETVDTPSQWVTFSLGDETYGINVMQVQEVLKMTEVAPVPGAPDYVIGIVNLRGNVVTVVDTRKRFGLPPAEDDDATRIVIIEANGQVVGMRVDGVAEVVELDPTEIETAPTVGNEETAKYIQGVHSQEDGLIILVDLNKFLTDEEWEELGGF